MHIVDCGALVIGLMFAMGQKQTSRSEIAISAYPRKQTLPADGWMAAECQNRTTCVAAKRRVETRNVATCYFTAVF
jgi:hypothetical protein